MSPEEVRAWLTVIPVLVGAVWLVVAARAAWRPAVWHARGDALRARAAELDAPIEPVPNGYAVGNGEARVAWYGGLRGARTRVGSKEPVKGWLTLDELG